MSKADAVPPPYARQGFWASCTAPLRALAEASGGWMFLGVPELHLGPRPDIVIPDLAGWRREKLPADFMSEDADAHIALAPDWVCEVLSDSTRAVDTGKKRRIWRREGVQHLWHASPEARTLEGFRLENGRWSETDTFDGDATVRAEPFDAIELDLRLLWPTAPVHAPRERSFER